MAVVFFFLSVNVLPILSGFCYLLVMLVYVVGSPDGVETGL
jgi:hypothetical protein